ncbi:MAG: protein kinase [Stenomitos rutilans HA7619-LM2]|jgi:serine/threonine protein kinase|nr:protein kinase [Stenomitos rutilans HA7619-LM2]
MDQLLTTGQVITTEASNLPCTIYELLGSGGQGEVYRATLKNTTVALKWYYPAYLKEDVSLRQRLEKAVASGPPTDRFLWPLSIVSDSKLEGFGYVMYIREPQYKGIIDLVKRRIDPSFRALVTAALGLVDSFFQLHAKGLCYCDISFGNVFFAPDTGDILICDNDNVAPNGGAHGAILGTAGFMAPEIVLGKAAPSKQSDLYSLAVLLFYMFMVHHPLEGKKEAEIRCLDMPARKKLYGAEPVFIFNPDDESNRPVPGIHDNAIACWEIYPLFLRDLFTKAFTEGLIDPENGRITEGIWRPAMVRLRDSLLYCSHCSSENFYDADALKASGGKPAICWSCSAEVSPPARIRIGRNIIMLNYDTKLFPHHVDDSKLYDFSKPVAEIAQSPNDSNSWGLTNLSSTNWVSTTLEGTVKEIEPGQSATLMAGLKINFGKSEGEIRL